MPNAMAALPNIGGAFCSTPHSLADAHYTRVPFSNAAKTRYALKFAGVPQTTGPMSAASGPKFTILCERVEEILLPNKLFLIVDTCLSCEDRARQICAMVPILRFFDDFLPPVFAASPVQHVSDLHLKFALRLHHTYVQVW